MPRLGGVAIAVGTLVPLFTLLGGQPEISAILLAALLLVAAGVWDDRVELGYQVKFATQIIAAIVVIHWGNTEITRLPLLWEDNLPILIGLPLTLILLLATTNAINLSDGLDGLAGGMSILALGPIVLMTLESGKPELLLIAVALIGGVAGFLRYNSYPAKLFMGDAGSQFIGLLLGVVIVRLTQNQTTPYCSATPLFLLGLPLLDTAMVMSRRLLQGKSPFKADRQHLHHRLLDAGLDHYEVVMLMYFGQTLLVISAYLLRYQSDALVLLAYFSFATITALAIRQAEKIGRTRAAAVPETPVLNVNPHPREARLGGWLRRLLATLLAAYFVTIAGVTLGTGDQLQEVVIVGVLLLTAGLMFEQAPWLSRLGVYLCGATCLYLVKITAPFAPWLRQIENGFYLAVALLVVMGLRYTSEREFDFSPFDFLVILAVLAVPVVAGPLFMNPLLGTALAELVVVFYASEFVLCTPRGRVLLPVSCLVALAIVGLPGLVK